MDCPNCRATAAEGARFCASCGTALRQDVTPEAASDATSVIPTDATAVHEPVAGPTDASATGELPRVDAPLAADPTPVPTSTREPRRVQRSGDGLRTCPACGANNASGRVLCATCGVDLETGEQQVASADTGVVHAPGPSIDVAGEVSVTEPPKRSRTAGIVAAIVVGGLILGTILGILLSRPDEEAVTGPVFEPAVYPGEVEDLVITAVGASSIRPDAADVTYGPDNMVDNDITTAWSHDPAREAANEVDLAFVIDTPAWVTDIIVANGAQGDDLAFAADGRVTRMALLVAGEPVVELQLLDQRGFQQVTLPEPQLLSEIRLVVLEAVPGDTYEEISISELGFRGHIAIGADLDRVQAVG